MTVNTLALVGLRGAGKSTTARELGRRLGWWFVDLDREVARIARRRGVRVPDGAGGERSPRAGDVLAALGEAPFRALEAQALEAALEGRGPRVIATGGGIVELAATRERLRAAATVVWLNPCAEILARRVAASAELRPPLLPGRRDRPRGDMDRALVEARLVGVRRRALYAEVATRRVDVDSPAVTPAQIAERILTELGLAPGP